MTLVLHLLLPPQKPFTLSQLTAPLSFFNLFLYLFLIYSNPKFQVSFFYSPFFALPFLSSRKLSKNLSFKSPSKSLSSFISSFSCSFIFLSFLMGDHLALLVDRLLTESTLEATIKKHKNIQNNIPLSSTSVVPATSCKNMKDWKISECRICQEEDEASNMEIPCSCSGSMKFAHRKCVQKWCNEKGDTTCEICLQQFVPGYIAPQELFHHGSVPMNFRGSWEISSRDLHDSQLITMVPSGRFADEMTNFDYYSASSARSTMCCRSVALIFTTLVVLRHSLPLMIDESDENSLTLFSLLVLRTMAVLLPVAVMLKILSLFYRRRQRQEARSIPISGSDEESLISPSVYQPQPHLIRSR